MLKTAAAALLITVWAQDMRTRSVSWPVFPLLALCGLGLQWGPGYPPSEVLMPVSVSLLFLVVQFALVKLYFTLKRGKKVVLADSLIGWGDIAFMACTAFMLPVLTFILFYMVSLLLILVGWLLYARIRKAGGNHIPLAGLQALLLLLLLAGDWALGCYDIYNDELFTFLIR